MGTTYRGFENEHRLLKLLGKEGILHDVVNEVNNEKNEFWMGMRNKNTVMIYYKGGKILEISPTGLLSFDNNYIKEEERNKIPGVFNDVGDWLSKKEIIKEAISKRQQGEEGKQGREKIVQQEIMVKNNKNIKSDWFLVDMEYSSVKNAKKYGRFDMIALSREKNERGKHTIGIIELKAGIGAIDGVKAKRDSNDKKIIIGVKERGSGIDGHIKKVYDFLYDSNANTNLENLRKEIATIISNYHDLGLNYSMPKINEEDISSEPQDVKFIIMCADITPAEKKETIKKIRRAIFENEPKASKLCLESKFAWGSSFDKKFSNLNILLSIVDKEREIKNDDLIKLKKWEGKSIW